jgi:hypothetical protein
MAYNSTMARPPKQYYRYETGKYLREKLGNRRGCTAYRIKPIKPGRKLLLCIKDSAGPRGGRTKAVALLRTRGTPKGRAYWDDAEVKHQKR